MTDGGALPLGPGAEFDLIRRMRARWGELAHGIGDDAAVIAIPRGARLVASTDAAIERVHFRREWLSYDEIGYRAVTAAASDLAAMAAEPHALLVALQLPPDALEHVEALADGIGAAARAAGAAIAGGNVARSDAIAITTTALGSAFVPLGRAGARPGDLLYVTGRLGGPAAAVRALSGGDRPAAACRERFARPRARIAEARWLASRGAVAAIDLSDGLGGDAAHLAAASGVAIALEVERLPVLEGATADDALGGEEFELLVAARAALPDAEFAARFGIPLTAIGRAVEGPPDVVVTRDGTRVATPRGYDHFSR